MTSKSKVPCTKTPFQKRVNERGETETDAQWYFRTNGKFRGK